MGPAIAPMAGGLAATYASWRVMQLILFGMAAAALLSIALLLPETSHPGTRGIDKALAKEEAKGQSRGRHIVLLNPFKSLKLLKSPNVLLVVRVINRWKFIRLSCLIGFGWNLHTHHRLW